MSFFRDVIAGERDDVGLEPVGRIDSPLDLFSTGEGAVVNIGKLYDAKTIELFWQAMQLDTFMLDAEHVRLGQCRTRNVCQAERQ